MEVLAGGGKVCPLACLEIIMLFSLAYLIQILLETAF